MLMNCLINKSLSQNFLFAIRDCYTELLIDLEFSNQNANSKFSYFVLGHVDAGKSTLMGHLLYRLGDVSKKAMHKYP